MLIQPQYVIQQQQQQCVIQQQPQFLIKASQLMPPMSHKSELKSADSNLFGFAAPQSFAPVLSSVASASAFGSTSASVSGLFGASSNRAPQPMAQMMMMPSQLSSSLQQSAAADFSFKASLAPPPPAPMVMQQQAFLFGGVSACGFSPAQPHPPLPSAQMLMQQRAKCCYVPASSAKAQKNDLQSELRSYRKDDSAISEIMRQPISCKSTSRGRGGGRGGGAGSRTLAVASKENKERDRSRSRKREKVRK
jgi:hypothetical protein